MECLSIMSREGDSKGNAIDCRGVVVLSMDWFAVVVCSAGSSEG
jgi:hypothetical protein